MGNISWFRYGVRNCALVLTWIGSRVILSIRRQQKKFEIEDETYNKVKEAIKEKENKNEK